MDTYYLDVRKLEKKFYDLEFNHIVYDNNIAADVLSKLGSTRAQVPTRVFVHGLHAPSMPEPAPMTTDLTLPPASQDVMMIDVDRRQLHRLHPRAEGSHRQELGGANHSPSQVLRTNR
jgi:hypothetical protein